MKRYFQTFIRPRRVFESVLADGKYFTLSFTWILIPIAGYTIMYIFLTMAHGAPSVFTPWLNIPKESYYSADRFLLAPSMLLCWLASASLIQVLSRIFKGTGTFEQTLALISLSISVAMWGGLVHDIPMSFLCAVGVLDARQHELAMNSPTIFRTLLWICYTIYFLAFLILFPLAVRVVHKLSLVKSIITGWLGFICFQVIFLVFNR